MIVFDTLFALLTIYLFIYCIYRMFFCIKARNVNKYFEMQEKTRSIIVEKRKLCIIIFATHRDKNLDKLLDVLNNQTYSKENYQVHVVYQKDEGDSEPIRDFAYGAQIHNIQNPDYFSKDKALNLFVQKIITEDKFDAFIFLGANRIVGEKYLENINKSIKESGVYVGSIATVNEKEQLAKKIKNSIVSAYLKYNDITKSISRSIYELPFLIDGENLVITADVLEKMGYVSLEDKDSELEFSLDLASNDVKTCFSPYIVTAIDIKNYDFRTPSLVNRFSLFIHYFPLIMFKNNSFREFIAFLLRPNSLFVLVSYSFLLILAIYFPSHISQIAVILLGVFLLFNFVFSTIVAQLKGSEVFWLMFYPLCLSWQKLKLLINTLTMRSIINSEYEEENVNSATINAVANNGKKDFTCKLDLVSEDGMRKVVFREGNRFIVTDSFLRMYDALADITYKLNSKGIILKTCQNCKNFSMRPDGTLDCLNGKCMISNSEILIWNGCQYFSKR